MTHLDWLEKARTGLNKDPAFRKLGTADFIVALKAGKTIRAVTFEAFEVGDITDVAEDDLRDYELVIEMTPGEWTSYLKRRAKGRGPSLPSLDTEKNIVNAANPLAALKFDRYNLTLQALFDEGARVAYGSA